MNFRDPQPAFWPISVSVNAQIGDDHGGFGNNRDIPGGRLKPAPMIRKLRWFQPLRLPGDRCLGRVFEHRGRGREQVVRQLTIIVVHDTSLANIGEGRFLCGGSPVEWRGGKVEARTVSIRRSAGLRVEHWVLN